MSGGTAHSPAGVITTAERGLRAGRIVAWRLAAPRPVAEIERMLGMYRDRCCGLTVAKGTLTSDC